MPNNPNIICICIYCEKLHPSFIAPSPNSWRSQIQIREPEMMEREQGEGKQVVVLNATRHNHELLLLEGLRAYKCSGCKEYGANIGYKCKIGYDSLSSSCHNFTLHEFCATIPDVFQHPFRSDVSFKFRSKTLLNHHCSACLVVVKGYVFETEKHNFRRELRLHPLCMALPKKLDFGGHAHHKLKLVAGNLIKGKEYTCSACDTQIASGGWRYRCEEVTCKVYLDPSCAKIHIYGFSDHGIDRVAPASRNRALGKSFASLGKGFMTGLQYANN